jgi:hypothetical protein
LQSDDGIEIIDGFEVLLASGSSTNGYLLERIPIM